MGILIGGTVKTYDQLTPEQQGKAVDMAVNSLLTAILDGAIRFADDKNQDDLQARIDAACEKANRMQTPWFADAYIMDTCADDIRGMAQCDAEDALYPEAGETAISGVA